MRHYCTLFDSRYAPQGLALYESLRKHSSEPFMLYVLPMDTECHRTLEAMALPHVCIVPLDSFEFFMQMEVVKASRTYQEWCWSCASNLIEYLFSRFLPGHCPDITYVDADVFFFNDPAPVFEEIGKRSIAITPHQFPDNAEKPRLSENGLYNVGFITFRNTPAGRGCLWQWAAQVRERCSATEGCGDQVYLDSFQRDFGDEVCILGHGINTGPWNLMAYDIKHEDGETIIGVWDTAIRKSTLVCFHFHEYSHGERLTNYPLRQVDKNLIYAPYAVAVENTRKRIAALNETVHL